MGENFSSVFLEDSSRPKASTSILPKLKISSPFNFEHKSKLTSPKVDIFQFENDKVNNKNKSKSSFKSSPIVLISKKSFIVESNVEIKEGDLLYLKSELSTESILVQPILKVANPFWMSINDVSKFEYDKDSIGQSNKLEQLQQRNYIYEEANLSHTPSASVSSKIKLDSTTPTSLFSKHSFNSSVSGSSPNTDYNISKSQNTQEDDGSKRAISLVSDSSSNLSSISPTKVSLKSQIHPLLTKKQLDNFIIEINSYSRHKSRYWYRIDLINTITNSRIYLSRYYQEFYDLHISSILTQKTLNQSKAPKLPEPFSFDKEINNDDELMYERCKDLEKYLNKLVKLTDKYECLINPVIKWFNPKKTDLVLNAENFHLSSKLINESLNTLKDRQIIQQISEQTNSPTTTNTSNNKQSLSPLPSPKLSKEAKEAREARDEKKLKKYQDIFVPRPFPSFLKNYENISPVQDNGYYSEGGISPQESSLSSSYGSNSSFRLSKNSTHSYSNSNTSSFESSDDKRIPEESANDLKEEEEKQQSRKNDKSGFDEPTKPLYINTTKPRFYSTGSLPRTTSAHRTALLPTLNLNESTITDTKNYNINSRSPSMNGFIINGKSTSLPNSPLVFQGSNSTFNNGNSRKYSLTSSISTNSSAVSTPTIQNVIKFKIMHKDNNGEIVTIKLYYSNVTLRALKDTIKEEFNFNEDPNLRFKNFKTGIFVNIKTDMDLLALINDQFHMYNKILVKFI